MRTTARRAPTITHHSPITNHHPLPTSILRFISAESFCGWGRPKEGLRYISEANREAVPVRGIANWQLGTAMVAAGFLTAHSLSAPSRTLSPTCNKN